MQSFEPSNGLDEYFPNDLLLEEVASLLVLAYLLKHVAIVRIFHDDTKGFEQERDLTKENWMAHRRMPAYMKRHSCV